MSARTTTLALLACSGLLFGLTTVPAHAAPALCPGGTQPVGVATFNAMFEGPLWAPVPQEKLNMKDRNDDGLLCARLVTPPSAPPGLGIPDGEINVLVVFMDNPDGLR